MNSRRTETLEILAAPAAYTRPGMPPLLFIHGAYTAAWCWAEHFLPYFAQAGFNCQALSLSGHGASRRRDHLDSYSVDDYLNDVAEVAALLPVPPVLIGHSMGGFVVQKYLEQHPAAAAVLMCSVPPQGLAASAFGMLFSRPNLFVDLNGLMNGSHVAPGSLQEALFAQPVSMDDLGRYVRLVQPESHRAIWDMMLLNLPNIQRVIEHLPRQRDDLRVMGAELDMIIPASLDEMTARSYGVDTTLYPGMGHGLMLERDWQIVAQDLIEWLEQRFAG
jgi:non-heme chloroperoxidase